MPRLPEYSSHVSMILVVVPIILRGAKRLAHQTVLGIELA